VHVRVVDARDDDRPPASITRAASRAVTIRSPRTAIESTQGVSGSPVYTRALTIIRSARASPRGVVFPEQAVSASATAIAASDFTATLYLRVRPECQCRAMGKSAEGYDATLAQIVRTIDEARRRSARSVNAIMTATYWMIGRWIVEEEQRGAARAGYGEELVERLGAALTTRFGRGFGTRNLWRMKAFFLAYAEILSTPSSESADALSAVASRLPLPWWHYVKLLAARPEDEVSAEDEIKDPFVLEFLGLKDEYSESDLEEALIRDLEGFLLELGGQFTFVGRQRRLRIGDQWFRIDLLFFHRRLRCLVIVDLKLGELTHADAGQMHMYLNYAAEHWTMPGENPPVGLVLCSAKDEAVVKYALGNLPSKVLAAEYRTALPAERLLAEHVEQVRRELTARRGDRPHRGGRRRGRGLKITVTWLDSMKARVLPVKAPPLITAKARSISGWRSRMAS
jgi:hypothetical protein